MVELIVGDGRGSAVSLSHGHVLLAAFQQLSVHRGLPDKGDHFCFHRRQEECG